jgi:hypothetical protein
MPNYVQLPNGGLFEVREGESPHQAFLKAQQQYPELFPELTPSKQPQGGFGAAFSAMFSRLGGEAALTAGKMGLLTPEEAEARYKRQLEKARGIFKPTEEGWTEAPLRKLAETAGGSAAAMLAPAAAGLTALAAPVVVPGAAAALGTGLIGAGLAGLAGVGQYTGSNLAAQMEEGKKGLAETSGAAAVGAAIPQAALDVLSFKMLPGVKRLFGSVGKEVTEDQAKAIAAQTLRQKIGDYTAATGLAMGVEGATEVAQDMLEKLQAGASLSDPKAREDYLENFIGGAALAGVLGPFGRGIERAGIAARGRELEADRLDKERKDALAARQAAAEAEARSQFGTLFPEIGPASSMYGTPELVQRRLSQIEQEVGQARQAKDMDALLRLQRERTALEAQIAASPEYRAAQIQAEIDRAKQANDLETVERLQREQEKLRFEYVEPDSVRRQLELAQQSLIERIKATPTPKEKIPLLNELVQVQKQLAEIKKPAATSAAVSYDNLLRQEKNILGQLEKTEGDATTQLKLLKKLKEVQEKLAQGEMFSRGAANAQQQFEATQAEDAAAAEAGKPKLLLTDQRRAEAIPMYFQETLFGPAERVQVPGGTETTLPALQRAVSSLSERSDLSPEDRSLLDRVSDLVLPKTRLPQAESLQQTLNALEVQRRRVTQDILNRARGAYDEAGLTDTEKLAQIRQLMVQAPKLETSAITGLESIGGRDRQDRIVAQQKAEQLRKAGIPNLYQQLSAIEKQQIDIQARPSAATELQKNISEIEERQRNVASAIEQKRGAQVRLQQRLDALQRQIDTYRTEKARLNEQFRQTQKSTLAQVQEAGPPTSETVAAAAKQEQELVAVRAKAIENDAQLAQAEASLRALTKKEADVRQRTDKSIVKLERLQENLRKELSMRVAQRDKLPSTAAPIEKLSTTGAVTARKRVEAIDREMEALARGTQADKSMSNRQRLDRIEQLKQEKANLTSDTTTLQQRIADWVSDISRGRLDRTNSQKALEEALQRVETAPRGERETVTKLERRVATPEERAALGKKTVLERVPTAVTTTAQQPDLFAGTEAARAVEFETPKEFQAFMASEELQKKRTAEAERGLTEAQKAGPPTPTDIGRFKKLIQPTVAFLNKQAAKVRGFLGALNKKLETFNVLKQVQLEESDARMLAAKAQQTEVLLAIEKTFLKAHFDYARAVLEMQDAQKTYDGLQDFYNKARATFDTIMRMSDEWASVAAKEDARFKEGLQERHEEFRRALGRLGVLRGEISNKFGDILAMEAPALEAGAAFDPELVQEYTAAKTAADKAATEFYTYVRSRQKPTNLEKPAKRQGTGERLPVETPVQWQVTNKDIKQFLAQDIELLHMLEEQAKVIKYWRYTADEFEDKLSAAREAAKADPVWAAFLKEAQDAVNEATRLDKDGKLRSPDKLVAAIRSANVQLRQLREQAQAASADQVAQARREKNIAAATGRAEKQAKVQAEMKAENERLAREASGTRRIVFGKVLSESEQERLADAIEKRDKLVAARDADIKAKQKQKKNMRLSPERRKAIAEKQMTRAEAVESQRAADIENIRNKFNAAIVSEEETISALKNEPSSLKNLDWKGVAPSEMTEKMQEELLTDAEKKEISDGTKTLEQVLEARKRTGRTGQTLVDVRTGRVSEGKRAVSSRDLTAAQQAVETAKANEQSYRNSLLRYSQLNFELDLSHLDTDALEYEILKLQAEAEERATLRRPATEKEKAKLAKEAAEGLDNPLNRILSHDYAGRENTPLDETTTAAVDKGDLQGALKSLAKNGSTPFVRMVAQRLLPMVDNTKLTTESLTGKGGEYDPNTDTMTLNKDALTEEDLLHEAGHAATNTVASYETEGGMTRRQFLKGAVSGLTAMKLPNITENMSLAAQEQMFFEMLDGWRDWVRAADKLVPSLKLDAYGSLDVANRDLRGFLEQLEYNEVDDRVVTEMLENGGLKNLQASINASQRAIMAEAAKTGEGKVEPREKPFVPTKEQLAARTALEKLYAKMQGRPEFKDEYANISFKEFVSELLSNQQVRDKVNQTAGLLRRIYEGFLRMLGIEPTTLSDKAAEQAFAMFSPSTVSVNKEERLASIMRGVFPGTTSQFSAATPQSVQDAINRTIARNATLGDKLMANLTGLRMRTFIADQWAPVEALMKMGVAKGKVKEAQALQMQVYMRLFSNMQEYTNSALLNGVPELQKDKAGIRTIEGGDKDVNARTIAKALNKASAVGNQQAVERMFTLWMATLRAKQDGIGMDKLNFKSPPTAKELADLAQFLRDNSAVKNAFEEARTLYKKHNERLLNLQVQTGAMSQDVANELGKGDYIGFYRVNNNGVVELMLGGSRPVRVGNVIDQPYLKELVGGDQQILPFFASMTQNTSLLMSMALKNMQHTNTAYMFQDLGLGKIHSVPEGKEPPLGKMRFKQAGNDYWFQEDVDAFGKMDVPFDLVMQGLQGVKTAIPSLVRAMAVPADILRKTVRRMPLYTLRQTIRDPMHAWMTTGGNFVPVFSTWKEMYRGMTNQSTTQISLKEAAVIGNHVYSGDTEGVTKMLRELSTDSSRFSQIMAKLDEFAMQGEAATRAVLYDNFRKKGMSHVEALLSTAETMNFSRRGTSASLHWLAQLTPFFNAQIQGLDAAYRALKGNTTFEEKMNARNTLLKRGALMAASTMAYALLMEDDETYKNSTPEERYGNWFVRIPGTDDTLRVPIPFEMGLIFKSLPEAFINTAFGDKKAGESVKALAKQVYMSSPFGIPTALKGPLEVAFNYNMYTDQPIETTRERALDVDQRYRNSTTELAKLLGQTGVLSPVQIDHLVRSYTGSMGIMLLSTANTALRPLVGRTDVEKPEMSLNEMPVIGGAFQPTTGRGMVNAAFDEMAKFQRAAMTYKNLATTDPEAARDYADKFGREIALASTGGSFRQQMGEFAQYKRAIAANPALTGAQKREQIDAIKRQEIEFAQRLRKLAA